MFEVTPLTILFGGGLITVLGWTIGKRAERNMVTNTECLEIREKIEENHRKLCPLNRDINVIADHDRECAQRLHPMQVEIANMKSEMKTDIVALHNKLDRVLDVQRQAITTKDLRELIEAGMKK